MQPLQPGDPVKVGRYRIGGRLGSGGMGEVFWGRSPSGRPVAVKIVHRHLATQPEFRKRFAQEVDAARRVGGFHTASVVDADPTGDPPYLVTAYVAGPSLAEALERTGPFPVHALRTLGAGLAEALEAVHAVGLVHRDLKPANVILADDGPRVIDFGIARALEGGGLTATGASIGTPRFMAPEQFGDAAITGAADVFALGSVLCAAAGAQPFGSGSAATVVGAIMLRQPVLDGVPPELLPIVARCLDKDPARRPTPGRLLDELSDGTPSSGWLPPPVHAMLAEHVLPDATVPVEHTQNMGSEPTIRLSPQQRTQQYAGPPAPQGAPQYAGPPLHGTQQYAGSSAEPAQAPTRKRGPVVAIAIAVLATVLVAGGVVAAVTFSGGSAPSAPIAAAPASSATETPDETTEPSTPESSPPGTDTGWNGDWQTGEGSGSVAVSIGYDGGIYNISVTFVDAPQCDGGNAKGDNTGSPAGDKMATTWPLTCDNNESAEGGTVDVTLTLAADGNTLTDDKGRTYQRI